MRTVNAKFRKAMDAQARQAEIIAAAQAMFEQDVLRGEKYLEGGDDLPTWATLAPQHRVTYIRLAAERRSDKLPLGLEAA